MGGSSNPLDGQPGFEDPIGLAWVYYVEDGNILKYRAELALVEKSVFYAWRVANGIGKEVELVDARLSLIYDVEANKHKYLYVIDVSQSLETYVNADESGLLIETLERTMVEFQNVEDIEFSFRYV